VVDGRAVRRGAGQLSERTKVAEEHMAEAGLQRVAAIDCGTNSLRLLIADVDPVRRELADLHRRMEIVRLGQGVDATGRLAPEALGRTFAMLQDYARTIADSGATAIRLVATSATRDASNADEFAAGVTRILGVAPEVVSGAEEAYLSFCGATAELGQRRDASDAGGAEDAAGSAAGQRAPEPPFLVVDIGGGSTEFVLGPNPADGAGGGGMSGADGLGVAGGAGGVSGADGLGVAGGAGVAGQGLAAMSMNIGCVRLTERHLRADPPDQAQIAAATADIDAALSKVALDIPVANARTLVGLAGSVTTLTAVALNLPGYDSARIHHARVSANRIHEVSLNLLSQNRAERARNGAIHPGRVDVIGAGALILDRIMDRFGFAEMVASEHDILDGIAWSIVTGGAGSVPRS
jgi:exopolyphosphatase/guanosine-5'-triphosphate,3'-diphosphate pyrophosphatase